MAYQEIIEASLAELQNVFGDGSADAAKACKEKILTAVEAAFEEIRSNHGQTMQKLQQEKEKRVAEVRLAHEKHVIDLQEENMKEVDELQEKVRSMKENHEEDVLDAEDGVRRRWMARMDAQEEDYKAIIEELKEQHSKEIEELEKQMDEKLELTRSASVAQLDGVENFARQRLAQKESELQVIQSEHNERQAAMIAEKNTTIENLQANHKSNIKAMEEELSQKLHAAAEKHQQERVEIEQQIRENLHQEMEMKHTEKLIELKSLVDHMANLHEASSRMHKGHFKELENVGTHYTKCVDQEMSDLMGVTTAIAVSSNATEELALRKEIQALYDEQHRETVKVKSQQKKMLQQMQLMQELGNLVKQVDRKTGDVDFPSSVGAGPEDDSQPKSPRNSDASRKRWSLMNDESQKSPPRRSNGRLEPRKSSEKGKTSGGIDWDQISPRKHQK